MPEEIIINLEEDFTEEEIIRLERLSKKKELPMRELLLKFIRNILNDGRNLHMIKNLKLDKETYNLFKMRAMMKEKTIEEEITNFLKNQTKLLKQQPFEDVLD